MFKDKKIKYLDIIIPIVFSLVISFVLIQILKNYNNVFLGIGKIFKILSPFIIAFIIAYVLNPLVKFFEGKFKIKRGLSILISYVITLGIIVLVLSMIVPKVFQSIMDIFQNIPYYTNKGYEMVNDLLVNNEFANIINSSNVFKGNYKDLIDKIASFTTIGLNTILNQTISFTTFMVNLVFGLIIAIYVLNDREKFVYNGKRIIFLVFREKYGAKIIEFFKTVNSMVKLYIGIKALDSLIIGLLALIGLIILKSPYALLIALIVCVTNMIPYFGPFIGMIPAVIINLFYVPIKALWVLIFLFLLQQFDAWYLEPKLVGDKVGLSPFLIILGITIGGSLFGVWGMLLASPAMAVIKIYTTKLAEKYNI
ncbi:AI-2E family transporter [Clostridium tepidum]|uniref:AI-2E family transporter n=1 Tax=Clostridium tepidum TaxID=1962263 RepID=A0A1S9IBJ5_9CLOT|nr:AI-2E family transporter [Clostridium tepidum]MCR1933446.1 AI-2E family transporter [Clostridium tepidum]MDU6878157.1 AI-2E family transporter [Clostridium botulinum]OOO61714.1 AI-2E family transporter [Clostridium tepidum]OOO67676.1 AI-2E family transporter [Clostridium tepidum]